MQDLCDEGKQMESSTITRREWRKLVKKIQRKKRRQKIAKERDKLLETEAAVKLNDPVYQEEQKQLEELEKILELKHNEEEAAWIRRELIAQLQFKLDRERREMEEAAKEALRKQMEKELEERKEKQRKLLEEKNRLEVEAAVEFESIMLKMDAYLTDLQLETPRELKRYVQSKPGQKLCKSYENTNFCRFGNSCIFDHRRPMLSRIILIHHFFSHPLLESSDNNNSIAATDANLESSERDLRDDYDTFFEDVVPELESFGRIKTFCTLRNALPHLRGNVFVEYNDKRSALKAFIKLQGRFYAMKRLIVEFSNLLTWRTAVCGMSIARKCPHGNKCNFHHLFKNPGNKFNCVLESVKNRHSTHPPSSIRAVNRGTPLLSWNDICDKDQTAQKRDWRWSESPEIEIATKISSPKRKVEKVNDKDSSDCKGSDSKESLKTSSEDQKYKSAKKKNSEKPKKEKKHKHKRRHSSKTDTKVHISKGNDESRTEHKSKSKSHKKHQKKTKKAKS